jgi:hypothetical protein
VPRHPPAASSVTATHILARKRGERVAMSSTASPVTSTRAFFTVPVKANRDLSSVMTGALTHWRAIDELDERQPHPQAVRTFAPSNRRTFLPCGKCALDGCPPSLR